VLLQSPSATAAGRPTYVLPDRPVGDLTGALRREQDPATPVVFQMLAEVAQERPAFVSAVSQMTRLPLIAGAGSIVIRHTDGSVLGAVGISGGKPDEDRACCEAGIAALSG